MPDAPLSLPDRDGLKSPFPWLHHIALITNDMPNTVAFYRDVLGSEVALAHRLGRDRTRTTLLHHRRAQHRLRLLRVPGRRAAGVPGGDSAQDWPHAGPHLLLRREQRRSWRPGASGSSSMRADPSVRAGQHALLPRSEQHRVSDQHRAAKGKMGFPVHDDPDPAYDVPK